MVVGTRDSVLALWQAGRVTEKLQELYPGCTFRTVGIKTLGDRMQDVALARIGDRGLFTKELETALLSGKIDLAVHSMKDLPTSLPEGLTIEAIGQREWPGDVLISRRGLTLEQFPQGSSIGTSSLRRSAQLLRFRPDLKMVNVRGNLTTRLRKLSEHDLDALVLAFAGINRLGYDDLVTQKIPYAICLPAAGQGSIGVEIRVDDVRMQKMVTRLDDPDSRFAITAERALLKELEGGCQVPVGALGEVEDGRLTLEGIVLTLDGQRFVRDQVNGPKEEAATLGRKLAQELLAQGAGEILESVRGEFEARC